MPVIPHVVLISVTPDTWLPTLPSSGAASRAFPIGMAQECSAGSAHCCDGSCAPHKAPGAASIFCSVTQPAQRKPLTNCSVTELSEQGVTLFSVISLSPALEPRWSSSSVKTLHRDVCVFTASLNRGQDLSPACTNHRIIQCPELISSFNPPDMSRNTPSTKTGCSKPHPTPPWTLPGRGHLPLLWATCSSASPPSEHKISS